MPSLDGRCLFIYTMPFPCREPAVALRGRFQNGIFVAWEGNGMGTALARVNQTRPHCVNQMRKTQFKALAERHGKGTAWERHGMCESALRQSAQLFSRVLLCSCNNQFNCECAFSSFLALTMGFKPRILPVDIYDTTRWSRSTLGYNNTSNITGDVRTLYLSLLHVTDITISLLQLRAEFWSLSSSQIRRMVTTSLWLPRNIISTSVRVRS
jgi:hypothetical protein